MPTPEPLVDGPERWRWFAEADLATRAANPACYWLHSYDRPAKFFWDLIEVSEQEYRASAPKDHIDYLDGL